MSFLYDKRTKRAIAWVWGIIVVVITFSMIIAYSGLTNYFSQQQAAASAPITAPTTQTATATASSSASATATVQTAPVSVSSTAPVTVTPAAPAKPAATWGF